MSVQLAQRIFNSIWFHAGPNRQRVLLSAVLYDHGFGCPATPKAISVKSQDKVEEAYLGLRETCRKLDVDPDDIITKSGDRFRPGPLTIQSRRGVA